MDVRSKKPEPFAQSEDQEDELLSIVAIKGYVQLYLYEVSRVLSLHVMWLKMNRVVASPSALYDKERAIAASTMIRYPH
jgi:hypothetical protein